MRSQIEGSRAVGDTVARCRPEVVCAYPITPQTHIVEHVGRLVKAGELAPCEFVNAESEFGALSVAIGASAAGARTYTATASQGLLFMAEALYNASGLGLPIVMTVANRAIGAPINIWNDHSDAMSQRDSGWIQLYAETNQEAADLHIQAFHIAETLSLPVMVCMDGFVLTHAFEQVDVPTQEQVDAFLPAHTAHTLLDPDEPASTGALVGPEAFTEVRYLADQRHRLARSVIPAVATSFQETFGRRSGGLVRPYANEDAEVVVVALGSVVGTLEETVDDLRSDGVHVGLLSIRTYRPFPHDAVRDVLRNTARVVVLERSLAPGAGGAVTADVRTALAGLTTPVHTVLAGLGGRPITKRSLHDMLTDAAAGRLEPSRFLDLRRELIEKELSGSAR